MTTMTVFIDGLKPDSVEKMPFLSTLARKNINTDMGYSVTCHATMYSGVFPNKHLRWFLWKYSPMTSPFKWINYFPMKHLSNDALNTCLYQIVKRFNPNTTIYNYPILWYLPVRNWPFMDMEEKIFWTEPNYLERYPSIFEILKKRNIRYEVVGMNRSNITQSIESLRVHKINSAVPWLYYFIGDIDHLSHIYGQESPQVQEKLMEIDKILEVKYKYLQKNSHDFSFMLFSDHGHVEILKKIDLKKIFRSCGERLDDFLFFIDANYARFWIRDEYEKQRIEKVLINLSDVGKILSENDMIEYHVHMPDNRYGDIIFYLNAPYQFSHAIKIGGKVIEGKSVSGHGYIPNDGVILSDCKINKSNIHLVDILPSIFDHLKTPVPDYIDGDAVWKR